MSQAVGERVSVDFARVSRLVAAGATNGGIKAIAES